MSKFSDIFAALAKAQASFPVIPRDKTVEVTMKSGGKYKFAYSPLDTIISAVRSPLTENGLSFVQTVVDEKVVTVLNHESGVSLRLAPTKIICSESGPQAYGSALTYARRYSLTLALGIVADEDDDANGAQGNTTKETNKKDTTRKHTGLSPLDAIKKELSDQCGDDKTEMAILLAAATKTEKDGVEKWVKLEELDTLPESWHGPVLGKLRKFIAAEKGGADA